MGKDLDDKIRGTLEQVGERIVLYDDLRAAIGTFLANFALFESLYLSTALKTLSTDPMVIEYLAELMPIEQRLKLLLYLCRTHRVPEALMRDVSYVRKVANDLREHRNEIAHGAAVLTAAGADLLADPDDERWVPGVRRPASKRPTPTGEGSPDVHALNMGSLHTIPTIRAWGADAEALQNSTVQLAQKLAAYRRGEPWEHMIVSKPEPLPASLFGA
jgi:hypothetical protein